MEGSQLMHDAVRVVERHGALLAQPLPLEGGAQGAHLLLLVLLLLGKLHEHLEQGLRMLTINRLMRQCTLFYILFLIQICLNMPLLYLIMEYD